MAEPSVALRRADGPAMEYVEQLLRRAGLPTDDVGDTPGRFYVAERGDDRIGVGGLEVYQDAGLLRSVAVEPDERERGLGTALVGALEAEAAGAGVSDLFLLTETAPGFFDRLGYEPTDRADAPPAIQATAEFAELCGETAVCMRKRL